MARANGNGVNRGVDPYSVDRDRSKHWCAQCHGNPACPATGVIVVPGIDREKFEAWKRSRPPQTIPYEEPE